MSKTEKAIQRIRQQMDQLQAKRAEIIEDSTEKKLERLKSEESELREALASLERVQSKATSNAPPSAEETELWNEIRDLMDQEQAISQRVGIVPSRYVRADALAHFQNDLQVRRKKLDAELDGLQHHQRMGARHSDELNALEAAERAFPVQVKPLCLAGQKIHALRQQRNELTEKRDALKAEREQKILATL